MAGRAATGDDGEGMAWRGPADRRPDLCAERTLTLGQIIAMLALLAALGWAGWRHPGASLNAAHGALYALFVAVLGFRLFAAAQALAAPRPASPVLVRATPTYTLLCPLYSEARVAAQIVRALEHLDYPAHALQILLLIEDDDDETAAALAGLRLGPPFEIVTVPALGPRTKPKALNIGLARARGQFCAVYDAEDRPDPRQLRAAVAAFAGEGGESLGCVQAPLMVDNARERWIAAQFAAEYAVHFHATLPLLARLDLPLPLGGTSNHFRVAALQAVGGWDPYNVTEDADLGYRLARYRWRVGMIDAPTWEEAPVSFNAWFRQRTRWIKGHLQTWLVLMRDPWRTAREMGLVAFLLMQIVLGGAAVSALVHAPMAALLIASAAGSFGLLAGEDLGLAAAGYAIALLGGLAAAARIGSLRLMRAVLTMPLYWPLATIAAWRALGDLMLRPHYWSKTAHGVARARISTRQAKAERRALEERPRAARQTGKRARDAWARPPRRQRRDTP
jgi:glycosyltransferase involved in cell wall biosynthesis